VWVGGGWGTSLIKSIIGQTRDPLLDAGVTDNELARIGKLLDDKRFKLAGHPLYSTSGFKPPR
jgi:hypothetical protein